MKLSTRTTLYYLLVSIPLFFFGSWLLYRGIESSLQDEVDEELLNNRNILVSYIDTLPSNIDVLNLRSPFVRIAKSGVYKAGNVFSDTMIYQPAEKEFVPYRMLTTYLRKDGQNYQVTSLYA